MTNVHASIRCEQDREWGGKIALCLYLCVCISEYYTHSWVPSPFCSPHEIDICSNIHTLFVIVSLSFVFLFCVHSWGVQHSNNICCCWFSFSPVTHNHKHKHIQLVCPVTMHSGSKRERIITRLLLLSQLNEWMDVFVCMVCIQIEQGTLTVVTN